MCDELLNLFSDGVSDEDVKEIDALIMEGYIDYDGKPLRCPHCGSTHLEEYDRLIGGDNIPVGVLTEFSVRCQECGEDVGHWAYGSWNL